MILKNILATSNQKVISGILCGKKVTSNVGDNLNIESQEDSQYYDEKYTSGGFKY